VRDKNNTPGDEGTTGTDEYRTCREILNLGHVRIVSRTNHITELFESGVERLGREHDYKPRDEEEPFAARDGERDTEDSCENGSIRMEAKVCLLAPGNLQSRKRIAEASDLLVEHMASVYYDGLTMKTRDILSAWLPLTVAITGVCALVFLVVQQSYRNSLNDPQIQIAEDSARVIEAGVSPKALAPQGVGIEISASLATWFAFYDADHAPQASTGLLHGVIPTIPSGIFDTAKKNGENRVTWMPEPGVRQAIVVVPAGDKGFVVAGRGMSAVEERENALGRDVLIGWVVIMLVTFLTFRWANEIARRLS